MAFTILNIGKANDEIARLQAEVKANGETIAKAEKLVSEAAATIEQQSADLATAKASIATLTEANKTLSDDNTKLTADLAAANQKAEALTKERDAAKAAVEPKAAQRAHEITAGQGQPPVAIKPSETPATNSSTGSWTERCLAEKSKTNPR
jgi:chromosome segregation ATPase